MGINILRALFAIVFCTSLAHATRLTDGKFQHRIEKDRVTITVDKGFHLNEKAPMTFKFYICDDKNTACEQQEIKVSGGK